MLVLSTQPYSNADTAFLSLQAGDLNPCSQLLLLDCILLRTTIRHINRKRRIKMKDVASPYIDSIAVASVERIAGDWEEGLDVLKAGYFEFLRLALYHFSVNRRNSSCKRTKKCMWIH